MERGTLTLLIVSCSHAVCEYTLHVDGQKYCTNPNLSVYIIHDTMSIVLRSGMHNGHGNRNGNGIFNSGSVIVTPVTPFCHHMRWRQHTL